MNGIDKGRSLIGELFRTIDNKINKGEIRIRHIQRDESADGKEVSYTITTIKETQSVTDIQLSKKIEELADRIHYGQTYPLESLDELIELAEAAKELKGGN